MWHICSPGYYMIFPCFLVKTSKNTLLSGNLRNQGLLKRCAAAIDLSELLAMLLSWGFVEPTGFNSWYFASY